MAAKDEVGRFGEEVAVRYLQGQGLRVVGTNWRCPLGELDIVAVDGRCLVVVEVKTRRSASCGAPQEAVTPAKLARLRRLAAIWLREHRASCPEVRIDVVAVLLGGHREARVDHLRAVG